MSIFCSRRCRAARSIHVRNEPYSVGATSAVRASCRATCVKKRAGEHDVKGDTDTAATLPSLARTLSDTAKALGASGSVEIALGGAAGGDGLIGFEAGRRRTTTRLLDGEYPKVSSIFPSSVDSEAVVETAALVEAVKRVSLVAERNTPVRLRFAQAQVTIDAGAGDDAQASEAVECTLTGPEIEIAFNPQYLLDGLHALGTTYARLSFTQSSRPAVLAGQAEADAEADGSYRYVLMPVRFAG